MKLLPKLNKLKNMKSSKNKKYELYSIFTVLIIEKEHFKNNTDLKDFIRILGFDFKEYIMRNRTMILSKVLKTISSLQENEIEICIEKIYNSMKNLEIEEIEEKKVKRIRKNTEEISIDELLQKFSRNK